MTQEEQPNQPVLTQEGKVIKQVRILNLTGCKLEALPEKALKNNMWKILILPHNNIKELPTNTPRLRVLKLAYNRFGDNIPENVWNTILTYKMLEELDVASNGLKQIPYTLNELTTLVRLNLFDNKLDSINITSPSITTLNIGHNLFSQYPSIPPNVTKLVYSYNPVEQLDNNFPNIMAIQYLTINMCGIKGISPSLVCNSLLSLELSMNNLADVPDFASFAPQLEKVDLSDNFLTVFPNFPSSIKEINLSHNQITNMAQNCANLFTLEKLIISYNQLKEFLALPSSIKYIDASFNNIETVLEFEAPALEFINFTSNLLTSIPTFRNSATKIYLLGKNKINAINTDALSPSAQLLNLYTNEIAEIPTSLFYTSIINLNVFNNYITEIPIDIGNWASLQVLNISYNSIQAIPSLPSSLQQLFAGYCGFWELPQSLSTNPQLYVLCVPGNYLTDIPACQALRILNASRNSFLQFPELPMTMETIDISYNGLSAFPDRFAFPVLEDLDVGHNDIMNLRGFLRTRLKCLRINNNTFFTKVSPYGFPYSLNTLDASNSGITFAMQPQVAEVLADNNPNRWFNVKTVNTDTYSGFAQMKGVRESMEDSILARANVRNNIDLFGVFDGHNGSLSAIFSSKQFATLYETGDVELSFDGLEKVMKRLVQTIRENKLTDGCTCALAVLAGEQGIVLSIGDVRAIIVTRDGQVRFQTADHEATSREEIERIRQCGGYIQNRRVMGAVETSRSLGDTTIRGVTPNADVEYVEFQPNDQYLIIASDGVFDVLSNELIADLSTRASNAQELAYDIRNIAFSAYSTDNISAIVVDLPARIHRLYDRLAH